MLEHLLSPEFADLADMDTSTLLSAQASTADWLTQMGSPEHLLTDAAKNDARRAFAAVLNPDISTPEKNASLMALKVPPAVRHLAQMLSEYDWAYIEQAKEIRGYVVAKLLEESQNPTANIRLRAIELLGRLSEVGSFSERIEVTHKSASVDEVTETLRAKLAGLLPKVVEVQEATLVSITP